MYEFAGSGHAPLMLHPSRVVRFLGNPLPDPWTVATPWSDSVLQTLNDAVHAAAPKVAGATSLMHEATAAMRSINNLLLGDGETWSHQSVGCEGRLMEVRDVFTGRCGSSTSSTSSGLPSSSCHQELRLFDPTSLKTTPQARPRSLPRHNLLGHDRSGAIGSAQRFA